MIRMTMTLLLGALVATATFIPEGNLPAEASRSLAEPSIVGYVVSQHGLFPLTLTLSPEAVHSPQVPYSLPQSRRDCVLQPRVASSELPWVNCGGKCQPQRGCGLRFSLNRRNPVGVDRARVPFPRVARCSQPWALSRNPVGIRLLESSCGECSALRERGQQGTPIEHSNCARFADRLPSFLPLPRG